MADHHGQASFDDLAKLCRHSHSYTDGDRFGRLFPDLPALYTHPHVLAELGRPGGPMDAGPGADRTQTVPVGHVFFGQFIDHDITLDLSSSLGAVNTPSAIANARTPTLDLDCVYGAGPEASPFQYHATGEAKGAKLLTAADLRDELDEDAEPPATDNDLPRNGQGVALIGDFRNDENRVVSQIQLGMIRLHNMFCDHHKATSGLTEGELFEAAHRDTIWHYQWAVVHDFLPTMCGKSVVQRIFSEGRQFYTPSIPFIPVEFSVAAYRFGHSMAPLEVTIRNDGSPIPLFGGSLGPGFTAVDTIDDVIEWSKVFAVNGDFTDIDLAHTCDAKLSPELLALPFLPVDNRSLAGRNLRRGQSFLLPSGEAVAAHIGRSQTEVDIVSSAAASESEGLLDGATPLWLYILTEAGVLGRDGEQPGEGLGPVGATIVAEVILGLLERDDRSWLSTNRDWAPHPNLRSIGNLLAWAAGDLVIDLSDGQSVQHLV